MRTGIRTWMLPLGLGALLLAPSADAASQKHKNKKVLTHTRSPHHCMKNGAEVAGAHKRDCRAGGGKWVKLRPAGGAPAAGKTTKM